MMRHRTGLVAAALTFTLAPAQANVYNVGYNMVNMSGASCRPATVGAESAVYHDSNATTTRSTASPPVRLFCPISRRGTTYYRGARLSGAPALPPEPSTAEKRVTIASSIVWGRDGANNSRFTCYLFGSRLSDQSQYFGTSKTLCSSSSGCALGDVNPSWTGAKRVVLLAPSNFNGVVDTVNFGIACDIGPSSTVYYTETGITPN